MNANNKMSKVVKEKRKYPKNRAKWGESKSEAHIRAWVEANGEIPREKSGRRMTIHHINGDHSDNRLENLVCLTNAEHARIHALQGDTGIIQLIGSVKPRIDDRTHPCFTIRREIRSAVCKARNDKYGNPMSNPEYVKNSLKSREENGTDAKSLVQKGTHNFVTDHPMKTLYKCSKTGRVNTKTAFTRWYKESLPFLEKYNGI